MSPQAIFQTHLVLGYVACLVLFGTYILPRLRLMSRFDAHRVIAAIHSYRFFGLVFVLPGVVGPNLPSSFATYAAYGDFATGVLAILALLAARIRPLFWSLVVAFNIAGIGDLLINYYNGIRLGLGNVSGQLEAAYGIPIIYVPLLMITHILALYWLVRPRPATGPALTGTAA
ncbi:MAG TPA: hypothetical protein VKB38_04135 [Terracidiphilus sp.]|nr:hypothetical protein [Terracidiphilus sp.]